MKLKLIIVGAALSILFGVFIVSAQDEDVRGAFLESRPKTTNLNAPSRRHRSRPANKNANSAANTSIGIQVGANANVVAANRNDAKRVQSAIGLGYTIFMRDASGRGIRVQPTHEFHTGDRVRLALEPSVDGYLYIFDSEDGGPPKMIYPDPRLDAGDNWIEAHVPIEVPSSDESEERLRWFEFYGQPGGDRIYIITTREPLPAVPTGDALVALCGTSKDKCPWQPPADIWEKIESASKAEVKVATTRNFGEAQTEHERVAMTRGLGLDKSIPPPSVIRINASSREAILVTVVDLVHK
ncbi:MAG TPA: DUF4384 domain-containing protein [Pyrinomonadaceae bacterium]|nr:DUF4384 domain-containing protein [Pyrinomonadaceae bacterium]